MQPVVANNFVILAYLIHRAIASLADAVQVSLHGCGTVDACAI
jgi:indole-3-glycerol phosphate synthase